MARTKKQNLVIGKTYTLKDTSAGGNHGVVICAYNADDPKKASSCTVMTFTEEELEHLFYQIGDLFDDWIVQDRETHE